ncbi:hypothetical protein MTO96_023904 [Rhipicephalus appendiculatus]
MRLCACVIDVLLTFLAASLLGARPASSVSAGKPNTQAPQLEAQFINQVVAKVEKLLMVGSGNTESLQYEVFEPHVDLRPATRKRRRKRRRRRRHLEEGSGGDSADLSLELPAFGQTLRLDLGQTEELISSQFQVVEEGASNSSSRRRRRRDVTSGEDLPDASCFYQGHVRGIAQSKAALSVCSGLRGLVELPGATYFVYPHLRSGQQRPQGGRQRRSHQWHVDAAHPGQGGHAQTSAMRPLRERLAAGQRNAFCPSACRRLEVPTEEEQGKAKGGGDLRRPPTAMARAFPGEDTDRELVTYVLTIMNAVQMLFKHESLGKNIDVTVVELEVLKLQPRDLSPSENIDTYLTNFCVWQHQRRRTASAQGTPKWDHALLLSGINMFVVDEKGLRKRHVVGLAPVSGMCNSLNSCTISEGTSFQSVYVASHEMGHSLGMEHDGSQDGNPCDVDNYVMSPTLGGRQDPLGRPDICRMLRCEMNRGITPVSFAAHPALEGTPCAENMWCRGGYCVARRDELERRRSRDPPVDGGWGPWSSFGTCRSDCVARGDYAYVGVKVSRRRCDRPSPQNGGRFCEGSDKRVQICDATQLCTTSKNQRLLDEFVLGICRQAAARDKSIEPYGTQFPSRDYTHSCYVWCRKRGGGYMTHGWRIPDGTPCWSLSQRRQARNTNRYCVDGECQAFDCYGRSTEDDSSEASCPRPPVAPDGGIRVGEPPRCGPLRSSLESATPYRGAPERRKRYKLCDSTRKCRGMVTPDQYATKVCEKYRRKYSSLLSGRGRQLPLQSGNPHVSCVVACQDRVWKDTHYQMDVFDEGRFPFGTDCSGGRGRAFCVSGRCQKFTSEGTPLDEESVTPRALQRKRRRRRIKRHVPTFRNETTNVSVEEGDVRWAAERQAALTLPDTNQTSEVSHSWNVHMSDCSLPCGGGTHNVTVQCGASRKYPNSSCDQGQRPPLKTGPLACNTEPCTGRWHTEPWGACVRGTLQSRLVVCVEPLAPSSLFSLVPDGRCPPPPPDTSQEVRTPAGRKSRITAPSDRRFVVTATVRLLVTSARRLLLYR